MPLQHRHEYAAGLPRGLPAGDFTRPRSRPPSAGVHRTPAHIRQVGAGVSLEGLYTLVPHVHLSVSLAGPGPSGSADPSRRCQGCSHPPRRLPDQAALSFTGLLRQTGDGVLSPPSGNAAPRGARSPRSRRWTGPSRCCRCSPGMPSSAPTTTSGTAPPPCSPRWRSPPARSPGSCKTRHRHQEFLAFLKQVARAYPDRRAAPGDGQLRRPQAPRGQGLAGGEPAGSTSTSPRPPGRG